MKHYREADVWDRQSMSNKAFTVDDFGDAKGLEGLANPANNKKEDSSSEEFDLDAELEAFGMEDDTLGLDLEKKKSIDNKETVKNGGYRDYAGEQKKESEASKQIYRTHDQSMFRSKGLVFSKPKPLQDIKKNFIGNLSIDEKNQIVFQPEKENYLSSEISCNVLGFNIALQTPMIEEDLEEDEFLFAKASALFPKARETLEENDIDEYQPTPTFDVDEMSPVETHAIKLNIKTNSRVERTPVSFNFASPSSETSSQEEENSLDEEGAVSYCQNYNLHGLLELSREYLPQASIPAIQSKIRSEVPDDYKIYPHTDREIHVPVNSRSRLYSGLHLESSTDTLKSRDPIRRTALSSKATKKPKLGKMSSFLQELTKNHHSERGSDDQSIDCNYSKKKSPLNMSLALLNQKSNKKSLLKRSFMDRSSQKVINSPNEPHSLEGPSTMTDLTSHSRQHRPLNPESVTSPSYLNQSSFGYNLKKYQTASGFSPHQTQTQNPPLNQIPLPNHHPNRPPSSSNTFTRLFSTFKPRQQPSSPQGLDTQGRPNPPSQTKSTHPPTPLQPYRQHRERVNHTHKQGLPGGVSSINNISAFRHGGDSGGREGPLTERPTVAGRHTQSGKYALNTGHCYSGLKTNNAGLSGVVDRLGINQIEDIRQGYEGSSKEGTEYKRKEEGVFKKYGHINAKSRSNIRGMLTDLFEELNSDYTDSPKYHNRQKSFQEVVDRGPNIDNASLQAQSLKLKNAKKGSRAPQNLQIDLSIEAVLRDPMKRAFNSFRSLDRITEIEHNILMVKIEEIFRALGFQPSKEYRTDDSISLISCQTKEVEIEVQVVDLQIFRTATLKFGLSPNCIDKQKEISVLTAFEKLLNHLFI